MTAGNSPEEHCRTRCTEFREFELLDCVGHFDRRPQIELGTASESLTRLGDAHRCDFGQFVPAGGCIDCSVKANWASAVDQKHLGKLRIIARHPREGYKRSLSPVP